ncbi:shikimate kinase [Nitrobacter hamburgensis X14]|uniref:Shikimate kinase n=1 Tax=Nitrobacter hamburgensis (strain DSM 10229 / NCIMB 13809 / X14) TaxID=323097 RepID=Q1QQW7_NITHX|nr:shikimate kinase [Nitrobacter hamburgensis]ABE61380.1 shikimate kinase [Nitrobacter hamburgensis X14]
MTSETVSPAGAGTPTEAAIVAALGGRSLVLVGMMGAGKSTIGRRLATRLAMRFVDADAEIERAAGMSIPEIFETHGEPHFRDGEARVIARLLSGGPLVLATGGGAVLREETRARIRERAISIWLKADAEVILRRVRRRADRPLLQTADPAATIGRLIAEREPVYQLADIMVVSCDVPYERIVDECIDLLHGRLCRGGTTELKPPGARDERPDEGFDTKGFGTTR